MSSINIPGVAAGAFFGLLALIALISCVPPITRFLGDLFCCPWRIPFTKKKRRNADEEMDKDDLPYVAGSQSPRAGTPVDNEGYQRTSSAYMSAVSVVDPELAKEEMRRSAEYRREHSPHGSDRQRNDYHHHQYPYRHHQDYNAYSGSHLQVPGPRVSPHGGSWRGHSPERPNNYSPQPYHGEGYSPEYYSADSYSPDYVGVQRPSPSHGYSPQEMVMHSGAHGYFPQGGYDEHNHNRHHHSNEHLIGGAKQSQPYANI